MLSLITDFNKYTETISYQKAYWNWAFLFFALSYVSQYFTDKSCGVLNELLRVFHQWTVFFIYFGFLAPITDLGYIYLFSFTAVTWWIYQKNTCFLTDIEKVFCGYKKKHRFHDLSYFIDYFSAKIGLHTEIDKFMIYNRVGLLVILNIFILARLYLFAQETKESFTLSSPHSNSMNREKIEIHGHRGAKHIYPENSIKGFRYAMSTGVDALELDLQITKDQQLVIYHDEKMNTQQCQNSGSSTSSSLFIKELELKQVQDYRCEWGEKIPSFKEFIEWLQQSRFENKYNVKLNIEMKTTPDYDTDEDVRTFASLLINTIRQLNIKNPIIIQSFDERALEIVREIDPNMTLSFLIEDEKKMINIVNIAEELKVTYVSPEYKLLSKERVEEMHSYHFKVLPWVINSTNDFQEMLNIGVDGIITDEPKKMIDYLGSLKN